MKLLKLTILFVESYKRGCKDSFDDEGYSICVSWLKLRKQNKLLKKYARHEQNCYINRMRLDGSRNTCTCGFIEVIK